MVQLGSVINLYSMHRLHSASKYTVFSVFIRMDTFLYTYMVYVSVVKGCGIILFIAFNCHIEQLNKMEWSYKYIYS